MIVWLDDIRNPEDYGVYEALWYKTSQDLMKSLIFNDKFKGYRNVKEWHFDNDLGEESEEDGYSCFLELEKRLYSDEKFQVIPTIFVHTSNPSAGSKFMLASKNLMQRFNVQMIKKFY